MPEPYCVDRSEVCTLFFRVDICIFVAVTLTSDSNNIPMSDRPLSESELEYYYHGLFKVLTRYRLATIIGWLVVLVGLIGIPLGWEFGRPHGLVDIALSAFTILAGLTVVQQAVVSLSAYVTVPMQSLTAGDSPAERPAALKDIIEMMKEVEDGGWQEAYAAIGKLQEMQATYGFPPLR